MKLTILVFLIGIMQSFAFGTYAQVTKLNLKMQNSSIKDVLAQVEEKSEFYFLYNSKLVDVERKVNVSGSDMTIIDLLNQLFADGRVTYNIVDRQIVLSSREMTAPPPATQQQGTITGRVTDRSGAPLPGVTVVVKGTTTGTITDNNGNFSLTNVLPTGTLVFSFVGMRTQEVVVGNQNDIRISLDEEAIGIEEVIAIGYGTQKRSDITGAVASMPQDRLSEIPIPNIPQIIQGAIPGVMIQTNSAGAASSESIMIRGRNSIKASNSPLIIVDGIPYDGQLSDINTNDVQSVEILKDASSAAIYGSRGSNGVILITTKTGKEGELKISYNGYYSVQNPVNLPEILNGEEFYQFKMQRAPNMMTIPEKEIYESGAWVDWYDEILRTGFTNNHNISVAGGTHNSKFYFSGGLLDVKGITLNDNYLRAINRINIETHLNDWLLLGTRSQFTYDDRSGASPSWSAASTTNPLVKAYDENGNLTVYPWEGMPQQGNPLEGLLYDDTNESFQINTNNFISINFPNIQGLNYRLNTGFNFRFRDRATYMGRDTRSGLEVQGQAETSRARYNSTTIENILTYNKELNKHSFFFTGLYSFESNKNNSHEMLASGFENDLLKYYAADQANFISPSYGVTKSNLISQMLRLNYNYESRYLITITGRRDGFSGFGKATKWGVFPSLAVGWNISNESFFNLDNLFSELKIRSSFGLNGNQAVGSYQSITRLGEYHYVEAKETAPGYRPITLGDSNLGWESSKTYNIGLDIGMLDNRITGNIDIYNTNTKDLLLDRIISSVHGITSITTNIGSTNNKGVEISILSRNYIGSSFKWTSSGNIALNKNKITSLYGILDDSGREIDDYANNWFIGKPIRAIYDFEVIGTWQLFESEEADKWGSIPGQVKINDLNNDYSLDDRDRKILGKEDPSVIWGITNSFSYKNLSLSIFIHGMHGSTKLNNLMHDHVMEEVRNNTMKKNWWTPENPTNEWYGNWLGADVMGGILVRNRIYQDAGFIRLKDISLSYRFPQTKIFGVLNNFRIFATGRNLYTLTKWTGLDPELNNQRSTPLQREYIFGIDLGF